MSPISINCHELDELSRLENSWRKYFPGGTSLSLPFKEDQSPSITDRSKRMGHRIDTYTPPPPPCIWKGKQLSSMNRSPISEAEEYTRYRAYQPIPPPLLCRDRFEARRWWQKPCTGWWCRCCTPTIFRVSSIIIALRVRIEWSGSDENIRT